MNAPAIEVIYEDNHLLVVNKPPAIATMGAVAGEPTIASLAADYIKVRYQKPGSAFVGIVSRLDSFVSGVLVLARTSKAAARLTEQFKQRQSAKVYLACVEGTLEAPQWKTLSGFILKNENAHRMQMVPTNTRDAQSAVLELRSLAHAANRSLVEINLLTGRKHQIRAQLSDFGHPIVGDTKYGATTKFPLGIALHSRQLTIVHPTLRTPMTFVANVPPAWSSLPPKLTTQIQHLSQNDPNR